jgi:hypothetical protein
MHLFVNIKNVVFVSGRNLFYECKHLILYYTKGNTIFLKDKSSYELFIFVFYVINHTNNDTFFYFYLNYNLKI